VIELSHLDQIRQTEADNIRGIAVARLDVSLSMLGRVLDGSGLPVDSGPPIIPEFSLDRSFGD